MTSSTRPTAFMKMKGRPWKCSVSQYPPGRLALPAFEIEQALVDHGLEVASERRIHSVEHAPGRAHELGGRGKRPQRLGAVRVDRKIPGPEHVEAEPLPPGLEYPLDRGRHGALDGVVEALAIGRGIVEAELGRKDVVPEVGEPGVTGGALRSWYILSKRRLSSLRRSI